MIRQWKRGSDPEFPHLTERERFSFPDPELTEDGVVGVGGNLSPGMLLSAYEQGVFPWYGPVDPIVWHSPDPRFVLFPSNLHISQSMAKIFKKNYFEVSLDRDFGAVIRNCALVDRPGQNGTWITKEMIESYTELHRLGWAHSAEAYRDGELVGGCYGIRLGNAFFGESMFARLPNASKAAFLALAQHLFSDDVRFIDCQVPTEHLRSLGAQEISRQEYLARLYSALAIRNSSIRMESIIAGPNANTYAASDEADRRGNWGHRYVRFPDIGALQGAPQSSH